MFDKHAVLLRCIPNMKRKDLEKLCKMALNRDKYHMELLAKYIVKYPINSTVNNHD